MDAQRTRVPDSRAPATFVWVQDLVIIIGPIASGKSTVAEQLAQRCAASGRSAAAADLDEVAFAQNGCFDLEEFWRRGGVAHAALVRGWLASGTEVVVAHGPLFESRSYFSLTTAGMGDVRVHQILLTVPFDVSIERVAVDPARPAWALSREPDFLRSAYDHFSTHDLPPCIEVFDTAQTTAAEIASRIGERFGIISP